MLPTEKGNYQARPMQWRVGTSKNGAVEFAVEFSLYGQWNGETWQECDLSITGYFYLITKNGSVNEKTVEQVEQAFKWDRRTGTAQLANAGSLPDCQIYCDFEAGQDGGQRIKVKWLNQLDHEPGSGLKATDPQEVQNIDARFGALLRGSSPNKGPIAPPPAANPPVKPNVRDEAKRKAWEAFKTAHGNDGEKFKQMAHDYFAGKPFESLGADQWNKFREDGFQKLVTSPIGDEPMFKPDDIPF